MAALAPVPFFCIATAAIGLLFLVGRRICAWWRLGKMVKKIPGPRALPIIGNLLDVGNDPRTIYANVLRLTEKYPQVMRLWLGPIPVVVLQEPDDIQHVLGSMKYVNKPSVLYNALEPLIGGGLTFLRGNVWRRHRKAITNTFHMDILRNFVTAFHENATRFAACLEAKADEGGVFDVTPLCGLLAGRTVVETVMASDNEDISEQERDELVRGIERGNDLTSKRVWKPWLLVDWIYSFTSDAVEFEKAKQVAIQLSERIVRRKREALGASPSAKVSSAPSSDVTSRPRRQTFLDLMLTSEEGSVLSDAEIINETRMLLIGAAGTSMDAMSFMYYILALRQDLQDRLVQELEAVFGDDPQRPVRDSDLPHLGLTERFVKETLRYFPVVPMFAREVPEDVVLPSGHTLPRGCLAGLFVPAVHRNPRLYPDPERFDPDRFLPERAPPGGRHPYAFLPFSAGPRNCVAHRYAMMFLQTQLAAVLRRVRLLPAPGAPASVSEVPVTMNLTASITGGGLIRTARREWRGRGRGTE